MKLWKFILLLLLPGPLTIAPNEHAHYRHNEQGIVLNDLNVTPGAVRTTSATELCRPGFTTKDFRHTTHAMKVEAYARYGQTPDSGEFEVDHLIPLTIGGADDIKNLWPQPVHGLDEPKDLPARPGSIPGYHQKDKLENALHRMICKHKINVKAAQSCIRHDWWSCARGLKLKL